MRISNGVNYALILNPSMIRPLILKWKFSLKTFWLLGFSLIITLTGLYIFQIITITRLSFAIANNEKQVINLDKKFKNLQVSFSDTSALSGLEETLIAEGYEKVGKIHYIQVLDDTVAVK